MQRTNYETSKNKKVEEQKDEIIADMDKEEVEDNLEPQKEEPKKVEKKKKIDNKSVYVS